MLNNWLLTNKYTLSNIYIDMEINKLINWYRQNIYCNHNETIDVGDDDCVKVGCTDCMRMLPENNWFINLRMKLYPITFRLEYWFRGEIL